MQIKIFNRDGTFYKDLPKATINTISVKNWWSIKTNQFEDICNKYITFELSNRNEVSNYKNRFAIGIVWNYSYNNWEYNYKILDILNDLKNRNLTWWYENYTGGLSSWVGWALTGLPGWEINLIFSVTVYPSIPGTFYYTNKRNWYEAIKELFSQIPSTSTYMLNFVNKSVINSLNFQFGNTWNNYNLYYWKNDNDDKFITNLGYDLSYETISNYIYVYNSSETLVTTLSDAASITKYWRRVKALNLNSADWSETAKGQQYLDKYKNPLPIINEIKINDLWVFSRLYVGDTIKIMSEWIKDDVFINNSFIIQDIIYNGSSNDYNLVIWDIINNNYIK